MITRNEMFSSWKKRYLETYLRLRIDLLNVCSTKNLLGKPLRDDELTASTIMLHMNIPIVDAVLAL